MRSARSIVFLCALSLGVEEAAKASTIDPCASDVRDIQQLADEGQRRYLQARPRRDAAERSQGFAAAVRCYQRVLEIDPTAARAYHPLGVLYARLERPVEAVTALRAFLHKVPEAERLPGVTAQIEETLRALRRQVAELAITTVPGLEVRVDQRRAGRAPLGEALVVAPGQHVVTVDDGQGAPLSAMVQVAAGQVAAVDLTAWKPAPAPAPPPVRAPPQPARLMVFSNRSGATVHVDGTLLGATPLFELSLLPGPHHLEARDGRQRLGRRFSLAPGERRALELRFPPRPWVWAVAGITASVLTGGAIALCSLYCVERPDHTIVFP